MIAIDRMFVLTAPSVHVLKPMGWHLEVGAIGRWLDHVGGALMNGINAFYKRDLREPLDPFYHVGTQWEDNHLWVRKQGLTRHQICQFLDFGFPSLRIVRNNPCCLCATRSVVFLLKQLQLRQEQTLDLTSEPILFFPKSSSKGMFIDFFWERDSDRVREMWERNTELATFWCMGQCSKQMSHPIRARAYTLNQYLILLLAP